MQKGKKIEKNYKNFRFLGIKMFLLITKLQHPCISPYINCHTLIRINPATLKDVLFGSRVLTQKQPGDPVSASC